MKRIVPILLLVFLFGCADKYKYLEDTAAVDISDAPALGTPEDTDKILTINTGNVAGQRLSSMTFSDAPWLTGVDVDTAVAESTAVAANTVKVSFPGFTSLLADYSFDTTDVVAGSIRIYHQTTEPVSCNAGDIWIDTDAAAGQNTYACIAGTFALQAGGATGDDLGAATSSDVSALFTGTGYLNTDGTASTPPTAFTGDASDVPILDVAEYFLSADVETVIAEIGADLAETVVLNFDVNDFLVDGGNVTIQTGRYELADPTLIKVAEVDTQAEFESLLFTLPTGGTGGVTEVATLPAPLVEGTLYAAIDTETWTFKSSTGTWVSGVDGWTYTADTPVGDVLFFLDFEGSQAEDLAGGWTILQPTGIVDLDLTAGAISGLQSLYVRMNTSQAGGILSPVFTAQTTLYYRHTWQYDISALTTVHGIILFNNGTMVAQNKLSGGNYIAQSGTVTATALATPTAYTTHYACGKVVAGTGANDGVHKLNFGTSSDASLNTTTIISTGNVAGSIDQIGLLQYGTPKLILDDFILSTAPIAACSGAGL